LVLDKEEFDKYTASLSDNEQGYLNSDHNYYEMRFSNIGGLVMPLILEIEYDDGTKEIKRIPAEIWRFNDRQISKIIVSEKEIISITLDPHLETADVDVNNNYWPPRSKPTRFQLFKSRRRGGGENPMQRKKRADKKKKQQS